MYFLETFLSFLSLEKNTQVLSSIAQDFKNCTATALSLRRLQVLFRAKFLAKVSAILKRRKKSRGSY